MHGIVLNRLVLLCVVMLNIVVQVVVLNGLVLLCVVMLNVVVQVVVLNRLVLLRVVIPADASSVGLTT